MKEILEETGFKKYIFWALVVVLVLLSYLMLRPYFIILISAFILAYLVKPLYEIISKYSGKKLAAVICILLVIIVFIVPLSFIVGGLVKQAYLYAESTTFKDFLESVLSYPLIEKLNLKISASQIDLWGKEGISFLVSLLTPILSRVVFFFVSLIIMFIAMYAFLVNWEYLSKELKNYIPFKEKDKVSKEISRATRGLVYGALLIGLIEFAIAAAGFYFVGVNSYLLLSSIILFLAFVPGIGPGIVWVPLAIFYAIAGNYSLAISVLVIGLVISVGVDTFLRTKILGGKAQINWFIMLLGILGGVSVFGLFGFIIGPLILVYTIKLLQEGVRS